MILSIGPSASTTTSGCQLPPCLSIIPPETATTSSLSSSQKRPSYLLPDYCSQYARYSNGFTPSACMAPPPNPPTPDDGKRTRPKLTALWKRNSRTSEEEAEPSAATRQPTTPSTGSPLSPGAQHSSWSIRRAVSHSSPSRATSTPQYPHPHHHYHPQHDQSLRPLSPKDLSRRSSSIFTSLLSRHNSSVGEAKVGAPCREGWGWGG